MPASNGAAAEASEAPAISAELLPQREEKAISLAAGDDDSASQPSQLQTRQQPPPQLRAPDAVTLDVTGNGVAASQGMSIAPSRSRTRGSCGGPLQRRSALVAIRRVSAAGQAHLAHRPLQSCALNAFSLAPPAGVAAQPRPRSYSRIRAGNGDMHGVRSMAQSAVPPPRGAPPAAVTRSTRGNAGAAVQPRAQSFFEFPARDSSSSGKPLTPTIILTQNLALTQIVIQSRHSSSAANVSGVASFPSSARLYLRALDRARSKPVCLL